MRLSQWAGLSGCNSKQYLSYLASSLNKVPAEPAGYVHASQILAAMLAEVHCHQNWSLNSRQLVCAPAAMVITPAIRQEPSPECTCTIYDTLLSSIQQQVGQVLRLNTPVLDSLQLPRLNNNDTDARIHAGYCSSRASAVLVTTESMEK